MYRRRWLLFASFFVVFSGAHAEARCPGNVASVHTRHAAEYLNLVTVTLNRLASYPFLLDTGAEITTLDPALAAELQLRPTSTATFFGVAAQQRVLTADLDELRVGEQSRFHVPVAIQSLDTLQSQIPGLRGVLGGDFLRHFNVLIDQGNHLLCLDTSGHMRRQVRGERLNLVRLSAEPGAVSIEPLVIPVSLSGTPEHPWLLLLDSGANVPFLWKAPPALATEAVMLKDHASGRDGLSTFTRLPPQDMRIGGLLVHHITFASLAANAKDVPKFQADGLLPTAQFRRIYIDYSNRFVVLEPW